MVNNVDIENTCILTKLFATILQINVYLQCWRVPSKIWLGLPDGHLGYFNTDEKQRAAAAKAAKAAKAARASIASASSAASSSVHEEDSFSGNDDDDADDDDSDGDAVVKSAKFKQYAKALTEMNCVVLAGFCDLQKKDRDEFVLHVMDRQNWAQKRKAYKKKKAAEEDGDEEDAKKAPSGVAVPGLEGFINDFDMDEDAKKPAAAAAAPSNGGVDMLIALARSGSEGEGGTTAALALKKEKFVPPVPGVGKGVAGALDGLRFVLT